MHVWKRIRSKAFDKLYSNFHTNQITLVQNIIKLEKFSG